VDEARQYNGHSSDIDGSAALGKDLKSINATELTIDTGDNNGCDNNRNCDKVIT
jgi:hypothetical protein